MAIDVKEAPVAAVLERKPATPGPGGPTEGEKRAADIRKRVSAEPPKSIREYFKERSALPPSQQKIEGAMGNVFKDHVDASGNPVIIPDVSTRKGEAMRVTDLMKTYLTPDTRGVRLTPAQQKDMETQVTYLLKSIPRIADYLEALPDDKARKDVVQDLIKNPEFMAEVNQRFHEKLKVGPEAKEASDAVQNALLAKEQARLTHEKLEDDIYNAEAAIARTESQLAQFESAGYTGPARPGHLGDELRVKLSTRVRDEAQSQSMQSEITSINNRIAVLEGKKDKSGDIARRIETLELRKDAFVQQKADADIRLNRLQELMDMRERLSNKRAEHEKERSQYFQQLKSTELQSASANAGYEDALAKQAGVQQEFIDGVYQSLTEAAGKYMSDKMESADQAAILSEEEYVQKATEKIDKEFLESVHKRWSRTKEVGGVFSKKRETIITDHELVKQDYQRILTEGPEEMMKEILTVNGLTPDQINEKLNDKEFMDRMQPKLVEGLLRRKLKDAELGHGAKMTGEEAMAISETPWGEQAIMSALSKNREVNQMMTELKDQGVIAGSTPKEWFNEENKGSGAKLLMLMLFGLTVIPAFFDGYRKALNKQMIGSEE